MVGRIEKGFGTDQFAKACMGFAKKTSRTKELLNFVKAASGLVLPQDTEGRVRKVADLVGHPEKMEKLLRTEFARAVFLQQDIGRIYNAWMMAVEKWGVNSKAAVACAEQYALLLGLAGWLDGWLAGCLPGWLAGWLTDWLAGWMAGWLAGWLSFWLAGWMAGWLAGWMAGWLCVCV